MGKPGNLAAGVTLAETKDYYVVRTLQDLLAVDISFQPVYVVQNIEKYRKPPQYTIYTLTNLKSTV